MGRVSSSLTSSAKFERVACGGGGPRQTVNLDSERNVVGSNPTLLTSLGS